MQTVQLSQHEDVSLVVRNCQCILEHGRGLIRRIGKQERFRKMSAPCRQMEHSARIFPTFDACPHLFHSLHGIRYAGAGPAGLYVEASNPEYQKVFSGKSQCFLSQREAGCQSAMLGQNIAMDIADESSDQRITAFACQSECPLSVFKPFFEPTLDAQSPTCIDQRYDRRSFSVDPHGIVVTQVPASFDGFVEGFQRLAKLAAIEFGGSDCSISKSQLFQVATLFRAVKLGCWRFPGSAQDWRDRRRNSTIPGGRRRGVPGR